jgi:membrane protein required for colicin V production
MPELNWFDYIIVVVVVGSLAWGLLRGFLREIVSLLALVLSVYLAVKFAPMLGLEFTWWDSGNVRYLVSFVSIFLLVLVAGFFVGKFCKKLAKSLGLAWLDRTLGALFGALRGGIVVLVMLFIVGGTALNQTTWYQQSRVAPEFSAMLQWMDGSFPNHFQAHLINHNVAKKIIKNAKSEVHDAAQNTIKNIKLKNKE